MKRLVCITAWLTLAIVGKAQQTVTLEECRHLAIQHNKELQISKEKMTIAENERKAAFTKYFPQISATGGYLWNNTHYFNLLDVSSLGAAAALLPESLTDMLRLDVQNIWLGDIMLVQPIFMGGKIVSYNQLTSYARELAESMNNTQLQEVIYRVDETYWQVISLVNKKKLADAYTDLLRKMDEDVTAMIAEGVATRADGLSVKVKLNEAEMTQTKVDNGLALSRMLLAQLCGMSLEEPVVLADEAIENIPVDHSTAAADIHEAFSNRQELRSLDLATRIYKKRETITQSEMLPSVALMANYMAVNKSIHPAMTYNDNKLFSVGLTMKIPLTGWWEGIYKRNAARAETNIKRLEYEEAKEKIELQVNQSVYKVNEAGKKLKASTRNMESAEENLRYATLGFEEGVIPTLNLMEAQTAWVSARSSLIDAQIEMKLTEVYLNKALGKLTIDEQVETNNKRK